MFKLLPDNEVRRQASQPDSGFVDPQRWTTTARTCPGNFQKSGEVDPRLCPHDPCRSKRGPLPLNPSLGPPPDQTLKPRPSSSGLLHWNGRPQPQGLLKKPPADPCFKSRRVILTRPLGQSVPTSNLGQPRRLQVPASHTDSTSRSVRSDFKSRQVRVNFKSRPAPLTLILGQPAGFKSRSVIPTRPLGQSMSTSSLDQPRRLQVLASLTDFKSRPIILTQPLDQSVQTSNLGQHRRLQVSVDHTDFASRPVRADFKSRPVSPASSPGRLYRLDLSASLCRLQVSASPTDFKSRPVIPTRPLCQSMSTSSLGRSYRLVLLVPIHADFKSRPAPPVSKGGENDRAYFGPSNIDFHITFQKPSRHIGLSSDQGLGKKHCPGPPLEELSHGPHPLPPPTAPFVHPLRAIPSRTYLNPDNDPREDRACCRCVITATSTTVGVGRRVEGSATDQRMPPTYHSRALTHLIQLLPPEVV
ncbi:hypothetical protein B296_00046419 [Ensete ventricosum]|uniref:Uncharacterized protein n=1 Tax=Ensete ventricosum TaxID=4639 RepID=A0A426Y3T8_ENSVE|nr:hypothetical protein B296_00046419 [Ensete ventricosum]